MLVESNTRNYWRNIAITTCEFCGLLGTYHYFILLIFFDMPTTFNVCSDCSHDFPPITEKTQWIVNQIGKRDVIKSIFSQLFGGLDL